MNGLIMSLTFTKDFFQNGSHRFGVDENNEAFFGLDLFLMDDGGVGVHHLLEMSEMLRDDILRKRVSGEVVEQYREHFGVIIEGEDTKIDSLLTDEILSIMPTTIFLEKLEECINFIKSNY